MPWTGCLFPKRFWTSTALFTIPDKLQHRLAKCQFNPFTPKSDQCQISPAASPEIYHHTVWRSWLFIAYSDERWLWDQFLLLHSYIFPGEFTLWTVVLITPFRCPYHDFEKNLGETIAGRSYHCCDREPCWCVYYFCKTLWPGKTNTKICFHP